MTTIDLGVLPRHSGAMAATERPAPVDHRWRGGVHRRRTDEGRRLLAKLSGGLTVAVVSTLTSVGAATGTLATMEAVGLYAASAALAFLVVRR